MCYLDLGLETYPLNIKVKSLFQNLSDHQNTFSEKQMGNHVLDKLQIVMIRIFFLDLLIKLGENGDKAVGFYDV
ncbi:hypothetical protein CP04DC42_0010 [Chlamydia psittaci 04DC42]|nr:hypothetical protein CPS0C_0692 [Chlamydia psittaci C19/98]AEG86645.1 hypothetical protein CPS0A_0694 [Chlamydia psittaci 01DC11]AEG87623.1 hypothetical protein CPS0B_0686 [Chlamydia psittaci 02DC15]AEG88596.1 hypothetical protein CPS0D_0691 [Chlamydia psittaci 08DC60]AFS19696.1 hypothetical protein B595_0736 [Chlamydia psittaci 84/55]ATQ71669.1 uncharacterized protein CHPS25_0650 [Chlamydia psittaci]EPJ14626.1 hypothetical protein CP02DC16_0010 [Chlamydia psittaci 02DC16]EPJ16246.1 hypot